MLRLKAKTVGGEFGFGWKARGLAVAAMLAALMPGNTVLAADAKEVQVVTSIKPVHALVASVMNGAREPYVIVKGAASPHGYALRPSDARALSQADLIFWIGPDLEAFLSSSLANLAEGAKVVTLQETKGLSLLPYREGGDFAGHAHEGHSDHDDHDSHNEAEHEEEEHHEEGEQHKDASHDDEEHKEAHHEEDHHEEEEHHDDAHHEEEGHSDEDEMDAHLWLDPDNAEILVMLIAEELAAKDPARAALYRDNAAKTKQRIAAMSAELAQQLAPVQNKPFIVFHDGYQYFEKRFGLQAVGSVTGNPDVQPGAKRVRDLQQKMRDQGVNCIFSEPQFDDRRVAIVSQGTDAKIGELDPLGAGFSPSPDLYDQVMRQMAAAAVTCLN